MNIKNTVTIETLTPTYDIQEDRIRLSVNYQDVHSRLDLMLTRALYLKLLPSMEEFVYNNCPNEIENIEQPVSMDEYEEVFANINPNRSQNNQSQAGLSKTNMQDLALYKSKEELLVTINMSYDKQTTSTSLAFITKEQSKAVIFLSTSLLKDVITSLKVSVPNIAWGISRSF